MLSEAESKRLLAGFGVPVVPDRVVADPDAAVAAASLPDDPCNPAVAGVRHSGKLCYLSADRAVGALAHLWRRLRDLW